MSTLKVDTITTISGTGNINLSRPLSGSGASLTSLPAANLTGVLPAIDGSSLTGVAPTKAAVEALGIELPAANLTGSIAGARLPNPLPAISGAALTNLPAAGDKRNFILDGDFTQWPEGTAATTWVNNAHSSALMNLRFSHDGAATWERSTDVPTVAASGHQSAYSILMKCSGTDASMTGSQDIRFGHYITGSNFAALDEQEVTISWWAKTAAANSGDTYYMALRNKAQNRSYCHSFAPTSTWTKFSHTLTMDTGGTWAFTEADIGLGIFFTLAAGPDTDNATEDTWGSYYSAGASPAISNFLDSTSNEFYISQLQCVLGSTAPTFTSPPIATVVSQVAYYIQTSYSYIQGYFPGDTHNHGMVGGLSDSYGMSGGQWYNIIRHSLQPRMRKAPLLTTYDRAGTSGKVTIYTSNTGGHGDGRTSSIDALCSTGFRSYTGLGGSPANYPLYGHEFHYVADARH
jgi:hypothetical protein